MRNRRRRRLVLGIIIVVCGLIVNLGEKVRGHPRASFRGANLGVLDRRCESKFVGCRWIRTGLASDMYRDGSPGLRVFGTVSPRIRCTFADDVGGLERDGGVAVTVVAFRPPQADPQTPGLVVALNQEQDGVMGGLRCRRPRS